MNEQITNTIDMPDGSPKIITRLQESVEPKPTQQDYIDRINLYAQDIEKQQKLRAELIGEYAAAFPFFTPGEHILYRPVEDDDFGTVEVINAGIISWPFAWQLNVKIVAVPEQYAKLIGNELTINLHESGGNWKRINNE